MINPPHKIKVAGANHRFGFDFVGASSISRRRDAVSSSAAIESISRQGCEQTTRPGAGEGKGKTVKEVLYNNHDPSNSRRPFDKLSGSIGERTVT